MGANRFFRQIDGTRHLSVADCLEHRADVCGFPVLRRAAALFIYREAGEVD